MAITATQRPGVFSEYTVLGTYVGGGANGIVGVAAKSAKGDTGVLKHFTRLSDALDYYGADSENMMSALVKILFLNRISEVYCVAVGSAATDTDYTAAYKLLDTAADICAVVSDCDTTALQTALSGSVVAASQNGRERIAFVGAPVCADIAAAAKTINCERLCMAAPRVSFEGGETVSGAYLAAAYCAVAMSADDPAANLNSAQAVGAFTFPAAYAETEIDRLLSAGITVFEDISGRAELIRAFTTKTSSNSVTDLSLRELSSVRITDNVIPDLRNMLKARLKGAKNNASTRDAIRSQIVCELSKKLSQGIIDSFETPTVYPKASDPTVCVAEISFAVTYGMNQIHILAQISV